MEMMHKVRWSIEIHPLVLMQDQDHILITLL